MYNNKKSNTKTMKILIIEDNKVLSDNIKTYLKLEGIDSTQLFNPKTANYELTINDYDLVILDLWLPDIDWIEVCKIIRNSGKNIPILMLTARNNIKDKISWFKAGADDYLTKPFDYEELIIRIQALVRRNFSIKWQNIFIRENIETDIENKKVFLDWEEIHLSNLEIELLIYLVHNKWKIITKDELLNKVWWEYDDFKVNRTVDVYVGYLRKKLWKDIVETVRWQWYTIN